MRTSLHLIRRPALVSLPGLIGALRKHRRVTAATVLITLMVVMAAIFVTPPLYQASASLLVKVGREYRAKPESGSGSEQMVLDREEILNSEIEILNNRETIEKAIRAVGLAVIYPDIAASRTMPDSIPDSAIESFSKRLGVKGVARSNVIRIEFSHRNADIAKRTLGVLIDIFLEQHLKVFENAESTLLGNQLQEYQQRLQDSEARLEVYRQEHRIYSITEQRNLLLNQHISIDSSLMATRTAIEELQRKVAALRQNLATLGRNATRYTPTERDRVVVEARNRLLGLQLKEQDLMNKNYNDDSRTLENLRREKKLVEKFLDEQEKDIDRRVRTSNPVYLALETDLMKSEAELAARRAAGAELVRQLADAESKIQEFDRKQNQLRTLERDRSVNEKNYLRYVDKYEEARIASDLHQKKIANISVIQAPSAPQKPVRPSRSLGAAIALTLAIINALIAAFIAEFIAARKRSGSPAAKVQQTAERKVAAS